MAAARGAPRVVLDASAVLALAQDEAGAPAVVDALADLAAVSAVNWAEVLSKLAESGGDAAALHATLAPGGLLSESLVVEPLTGDDCLAIAQMRPVTRALGLSLADRACLAIAQRLAVPAMTADHGWEDAAGMVGVEVILIR